MKQLNSNEATEKLSQNINKIFNDNKIFNALEKKEDEQKETEDLTNEKIHEKLLKIEKHIEIMYKMFKDRPVYWRD